jgi:hypothetical protein
MRLINDPIFFKKTVSSDWYMNDIPNPFLNQLTTNLIQYKHIYSMVTPIPP